MSLRELQKDLKLEIDHWYTHGVVTDSNYSFGDTLISYQSYVPGSSMSGSYNDIFNTLKSERMYTAKFLDDSFVQIYVCASGKRISKLKYAYYPVPGDHSACIRIDYSPEQYKVCHHSKVHLQVSSCEDIRMSSSVLYRPEVFIEFIVRNKFKEKWESRFPGATEYIKNINELDGQKRDDYVNKQMSFIRMCDLFVFYDRFEPFESHLGDIFNDRSILLS